MSKLHPLWVSAPLIAAALLGAPHPASAEAGAAGPGATAKPIVGNPVVVLKRPDLKITAKASSAKGPVYDFLIENVGQAPSKEVSIKFYLHLPCLAPVAFGGEGRLIKTGTVKALPVTTSPSMAMSYSVALPTAFESSGCRLRAIVDQEKTLTETSELNNEATITTVPVPKADLVLVFQAGAAANENKLGVKNRGNVAAGPTKLTMYCSCTPTSIAGKSFYPCDPANPTVAGASKNWEWSVPALAPGQVHYVQFPLSAQNPNNTKWRAVADSGNKVPESNEFNNELSN